MDEYLVKDIMKNQVVSVDSSMSIRSAAKIMQDAGVGSVIIMEKNTAIGILTERDFVRRVVADGKELSSSVKEVMSSPLIVISQDETIWEAAELMKLRKIHRVPVVNENKLVGIVTTTDLTRVCSIGSDAEMRKVVDNIMLRMKET